MNPLDFVLTCISWTIFGAALSVYVYGILYTTYIVIRQTWRQWTS